jgi:hypothetical protein
VTEPLGIGLEELSAYRLAAGPRRVGPIFAVGDAHPGSIKRVASAVGEGSMAVRLVHQCLAT